MPSVKLLSYSLTTDIFCCQGREKDATVNQQKVGHCLTQSLRKLIEPFFLRRTKQDVGMVDCDQSEKEEKASATGGGAK